WLRYMPAIPASASAHIRTLSEFRMTSSVVVMEARSTCGWLMLTPTKIAPATAAQTPAAWVSRVAVIAMARLLSPGLVAGRMSDGVEMLGTGLAPAHHHMM